MDTGELIRARAYAARIRHAAGAGEDNDLSILAKAFLALDAENSRLRGAAPGNGWGGPFGAGPSEIPMRGCW